ncbi:hypothetical protein CSC12_3638 [Klebsiella michiganensis]|nr:hypothetical protein CSC12_3638 [Klebsiella michiganensis]
MILLVLPERFPGLRLAPYPGYGFTAVCGRVARTGASSAASGISPGIECVCAGRPGGAALTGLRVYR